MARLTRYIAYALLPFTLLSGQVTADEQTPLALKPNAPTTYTVVKGDTLWDISALYLDSPWLWPRLWQVNPEIDNPHLIYPGDKLTLFWRDGQPVLSLKPMRKLSPQVRVLEKQAVPTVQEGLVLPYLQSDRLMAKTALQGSVRVIGSSEGRQYLTKQDQLYISGVHSEKKWGIYREVAQYQRDDEVMVALRLVAVGELAMTGGNFSGLSLQEQNQEILANDIALPEIDLEERQLSTTFYPQPAPAGSEARILGSLEGSQYAGQNQVVVIDQGRSDGVAQGSMFELYQAAVQVKAKQDSSTFLSERLNTDVQLPSVKVGALMVIRPYERFSLALITNSLAPISAEVHALSPQAEPQTEQPEVVQLSEQIDLVDDAS
ncbi:LysM peptidoglycan-binding domain-containing protein [Vibrio cholerae]|uniref:LysM peptidoglycan-binding domain-containing protein n=1 Tax=Vibrio cholerae TaxID=666 RepID=UPI0004E46746|nr:LysM peptidoglycan-binding domain-containing protein [Vibrio cholerae]EJL6448705.1 LysM peptidoglycan-binding domain-containing protein [Vibrio cholerae]EKB3500222.1 LysM peptidoglycan-binding domain-containing protein [Vibrio cholerae]EKF9766790.1 LysM peptidoglycan-binding domain-containing protein [Vibrio cholerae]ELL8516262.1 LysM peptidoglycan-binding domain-containing protein [Vibrio cholerae]KFD97423.1 lysM domain protein [Vibrio cholerae]